MATVFDDNLEPPPIHEPFIVNGEISKVWLQFFENIKRFQGVDNAAIALNTAHRTSNGTDHTYINQNVTTTSSPTFNGLTVDLRV